MAQLLLVAENGTSLSGFSGGQGDRSPLTKPQTREKQRMAISEIGEVARRRGGKFNAPGSREGTSPLIGSGDTESHQVSSR